MSTPIMRRTIANLCMSMVRNYYHDLCEFYAGDAGRFDRMVGQGGRTMPSASPQGWAKHIDLLALECIDYHADELRRIFDQLTAWGLTVDHSVFADSTTDEVITPTQ